MKRTTLKDEPIIYKGKILQPVKIKSSRTKRGNIIARNLPYLNDYQKSQLNKYYRNEDGTYTNRGVQYIEDVGTANRTGTSKFMKDVNKLAVIPIAAAATPGVMAAASAAPTLINALGNPFTTATRLLNTTKYARTASAADGIINMINSAKAVSDNIKVINNAVKGDDKAKKELISNAIVSSIMAGTIKNDNIYNLIGKVNNLSVPRDFRKAARFIKSGRSNTNYGDITDLAYFNLTPQEAYRRSMRDMESLNVGESIRLDHDLATSTDSYPMLLHMMNSKITPNFKIVYGGTKNKPQYVLLNDFGKLRGEEAVSRINKKIDVLNKDRGLDLPKAVYSNNLFYGNEKIIRGVLVPSVYGTRVYKNGGMINFKRSLKNNGGKIYLKTF